MKALKQIIQVLLCIIVFASCSENKEEKTYTQEKYATGSFSPFFQKFSTDSVFQKSRIEFPLYYSFTELEENVIHKVRLDKKNWDYTNFLLDSLAKNRETNRFETQFFQKTDTVKYQRNGIDNGINMTYIFTLQEDGKWFLTEIIDSST